MPVDRQKKHEPRITVLYLLYPNGPGYQKHRPIRRLHRILARLGGQKTVIYIDNSLADAQTRELGNREYAISGNNDNYEFSGWQSGLDFARSQQLTGDVYLFANDTFLSHSRYHRRLLNRATVECALKHSAMVGKRMILGAEGDILGNPLIPYVRTHLFLLPSDVVNALGSVVSLDDAVIDRILLSAYDPLVPLFRKEAPVSSAIRDYIFFHLNSTWHRKKPYTEEHFDELRGKAISILNSLLLSMRVHQMGYPLVSYGKTSWFLRTAPDPVYLRQEWIDGHAQVSAAEGKSDNRFWQANSASYRRMPARKHPFTLENLLDFLERREHPEHL